MKSVLRLLGWVLDLGLSVGLLCFVSKSAVYFSAWDAYNSNTNICDAITVQSLLWG